MVKSQLPEGAEVRAKEFMPDTVAGYNDDIEAAAYDAEKAKARSRRPVRRT